MFSAGGVEGVDFSMWLVPKDAKGKTIGAYTTRAFNGAKCAALAAKLSDAKVRTVSSAAYASAREVWMKYNKK